MTAALCGVKVLKVVVFLVIVWFRHHLGTNESPLKLRFEPTCVC